MIKDFMDIKRIIQEYYKQCYAYIFDNVHEMDQLLERHNPPNFIQEKIGI